ncbi:MAG: peptidoglycan-binding protein [Planctomycetes bacterium]|jgi:hypothetical protein|nr:peptidoglycan-binding protein [Planctomycetota bacterium]
MIWLESGDRLPMVAVLQDLLRRQEKISPAPKVDGVFGPNTKAAVMAFQKAAGLTPDGIAGPKVWKALTQANPRLIVDVVDTNHPTVQKLVQDVLVPFGSVPFNPPFLSRALELIAQHVRKKVAEHGELFLLRLFGHGNRGQQNLSTGLGGHWMDQPGAACPVGDLKTKKDGRKACVYPTGDGEALTLENIDQVRRHLQPLANCFAPLGSLELHGCEIARQQEGQMFLFRLALLMGVPVTASFKGNKVGTVKQVLRVEHPSTWFPMAGDLVSWAKNAVEVAAGKVQPASAK